MKSILEWHNLYIENHPITCSIMPALKQLVTLHFTKTAKKEDRGNDTTTSVRLVVLSFCIVTIGSCFILRITAMSSLWKLNWQPLFD